jgi:hypothetical protein
MVSRRALAARVTVSSCSVSARSFAVKSCPYVARSTRAGVEVRVPVDRVEQRSAHVEQLADLRIVVSHAPSIRGCAPRRYRVRLFLRGDCSLIDETTLPGFE